jgi:hypothetical protein
MHGNIDMLANRSVGSRFPPWLSDVISIIALSPGIGQLSGLAELLTREGGYVRQTLYRSYRRVSTISRACYMLQPSSALQEPLSTYSLQGNIPLKGV